MNCTCLHRGFGLAVRCAGPGEYDGICVCACHSEREPPARRILFTVPGPPVPKERARVVRRKDGGRTGITPDKTANYEKYFAMHALEARQKLPFQWPIDKHIRYSLLRMLVYELPSQRGDIDNYLKTALDACAKVLYPNDRRVKRIVGPIEIMVDRERPRIEIAFEAHDV